MSDKINTNPLVSVVMPLYNAEKTLVTSVSTVISQTYKNIELIIIDDKSTDDSYKVAVELSRQDSRIIVIQLQTNSGAGIARNNAIRVAKGEFIAFLDADDKWESKKIEKQIDAFKKTKAALIFSGYTIVNTNHELIGFTQPKEWVNYKYLLRENVIGCLTAIYDVQKIGKQYMPNLRKRQDYALWLNILREHGPAYCIQETLSEYYVQPNSISSNKLEMLKWNYLMFKTTQDFGSLCSLYLTIQNAWYKIKKNMH